jgi:putative Holliday junction resolvase
MRIGRRIAFDIGKARIGVAVSDVHGILASPRDFVARQDDDQETITALLHIVTAEDPIEIYCGLPINLQNNATNSTADAVHLSALLQTQTAVPVRLVDERLSTKLASSAMQAAGKNTKGQRAFIDSAAAAVILESALSFEKAQDKTPGIAVKDYIDEE